MICRLQVLKEESSRRKGSEWHLKTYCDGRYPFVRLYGVQGEREAHEVWTRALTQSGLRARFGRG